MLSNQKKQLSFELRQAYLKKAHLAFFREVYLELRHSHQTRG